MMIERGLSVSPDDAVRIGPALRSDRRWGRLLSWIAPQWVVPGYDAPTITSVTIQPDAVMVPMEYDPQRPGAILLDADKGLCLNGQWIYDDTVEMDATLRHLWRDEFWWFAGMSVRASEPMGHICWCKVLDPRPIAATKVSPKIMRKLRLPRGASLLSPTQVEIARREAIGAENALVDSAGVPLHLPGTSGWATLIDVLRGVAGLDDSLELHAEWPFHPESRAMLVEPEEAREASSRRFPGLTRLDQIRSLRRQLKASGITDLAGTAAERLVASAASAVAPN